MWIMLWLFRSGIMSAVEGTMEVWYVVRRRGDVVCGAKVL